MSLATHLLAQSVPRFSGANLILFVAVFACGTLGWLIAAVLGFARARAFGASARWFALAATCMLIFHLYLVCRLLLEKKKKDVDKVLSFGSFIILFPALCAL